MCSMGVALAVFFSTGSGCGRKPLSAPGSGVQAVELEYEGIDRAPGARREVRMTHGKTVTLEAKSKSVTATLEDGKLIVAAARNARGKHVVRVIDSQGKDAVLAVNIKGRGKIAGG